MRKIFDKRLRSLEHAHAAALAQPFSPQVWTRMYIEAGPQHTALWQAALDAIAPHLPGLVLPSWDSHLGHILLGLVTAGGYEHEGRTTVFSANPNDEEQHARQILIDLEASVRTFGERLGRPFRAWDLVIDGACQPCDVVAHPQA